MQWVSMTILTTKSTHSKCIPYSVDFICVSAYIYHTIFAQVKHLTTT